MNHIRFPVRVYWEDTDAGGIVYHANYLKFMERARSDMLRRIGFGQNDQRGREDGVLFVVASLNIAYHRAAVLDDDLEVITSIEKLGRASLIFEQRIVRGDEPIATGKVRVGVIGARSFVPTPARRPLRNDQSLHGRGSLSAPRRTLFHSTPFKKRLSKMQPTADLSILTLVANASLVVKCVLAILVFLSLASWTVIFQKYFTISPRRATGRGVRGPLLERHGAQSAS